MRSRLALTLGVALLLIGSLPAQRGPFRPPIPTPPPIRPPGMPGTNIGGTNIGGTGIGRGMGMPEKTWHCPKCNRQLGTGPFAPTSVACCGVNYFAGHSMPSGFGPTPPATNPPPVVPPATNPPGIGIPEKTWHCPKCNRQLGTGLLPPASATCCGTTYVGGHGLPGFNPPMAANSDPVAPPAPAPVFVAPPVPAPAAAPAASSFNGGIIASIIGIVLFGLFIVAGVAVMIIQNQAASRPSRPRRRRRRDDDEDDYDR